MAQKKTFHLTQVAFDRLQAELSELEGEGRQNVIDEIARARAHGDLSENAEYHAAKDQQGLMEARIRELREMIENAEIIRSDTDEVVKVGKIVTIRYRGDDEPETYLLGLREEKDGGHEVLTPESPLGRALLGHGVGDEVSAKVPSGELTVEIVAVRAR